MALIKDDHKVLAEDLVPPALTDEANELLNKLAEDIENPEALMEPEMTSSDR